MIPCRQTCDKFVEGLDNISFSFVAKVVDLRDTKTLSAGSELVTLLGVSLRTPSERCGVWRTPIDSICSPWMGKGPFMADLREIDMKE